MELVVLVFVTALLSVPISMTPINDIESTTLPNVSAEDRLKFLLDFSLPDSLPPPSPSADYREEDADYDYDMHADTKTNMEEKMSGKNIELSTIKKDNVNVDIKMSDKKDEMDVDHIKDSGKQQRTREEQERKMEEKKTMEKAKTDLVKTMGMLNKLQDRVQQKAIETLKSEFDTKAKKANQNKELSQDDKVKEALEILKKRREQLKQFGLDGRVVASGAAPKADITSGNQNNPGISSGPIGGFGSDGDPDEPVYNADNIDQFGSDSPGQQGFGDYGGNAGQDYGGLDYGGGGGFGGNGVQNPAKQSTDFDYPPEDRQQFDYGDYDGAGGNDDNDEPVYDYNNPPTDGSEDAPGGGEDGNGNDYNQYDYSDYGKGASSDDSQYQYPENIGNQRQSQRSIVRTSIPRIPNPQSPNLGAQSQFGANNIAPRQSLSPQSRFRQQNSGSQAYGTAGSTQYVGARPQYGASAPIANQAYPSVEPSPQNGYQAPSSNSYGQYNPQAQQQQQQSYQPAGYAQQEHTGYTQQGQQPYDYSNQAPAQALPAHHTSSTSQYQYSNNQPPVYSPQPQGQSQSYGNQQQAYYAPQPNQRAFGRSLKTASTEISQPTEQAQKPSVIYRHALFQKNADGTTDELEDEDFVDHNELNGKHQSFVDNYLPVDYYPQQPYYPQQSYYPQHQSDSFRLQFGGDYIQGSF